MAFDLENPLFQDSKDALFLHESDHMTSLPSDLDSSDDLRRRIISFIANFSHHFPHPFLSYLATNYLHRFLAVHGVPGEKPWILKLVAVCCVSLALKMVERESCFSDVKNLMMFDVEIVQRMEFLILGALKWRMRSITPFAFMDFFMAMFKASDTSLDYHHQVLKQRAKEIIFQSQIDSKLLAFKPSLIAASALLSASHELYPLQTPDFKQSISSCSYVNQDEFSRCFSMIEENVMDGYESVLSCKTPINVLDLDYSSSEDTEENRGSKRIKMSTFMMNTKSPFQLS